MALQRRLGRQQKRARRRAGRKGNLPEQQPSDPYPPKMLSAKQGGKVESYQDQVVRKFGGGKIKKQAGGATGGTPYYGVEHGGRWNKPNLGRITRKKAVGRPYLATNTFEPTNVRKKRPGGFSKGGRTKTK